MPDKSNIYHVISLTWKGHLKRIRIEPGGQFMTVPLSACVSKGDSVKRVSSSIVLWSGFECKTTCQRIFRYLCFRLRKPRPLIAKADPEEQAAFKKRAKPGKRSRH